MNVQHSLRAYVFVEDDEQAGTSFSVVSPCVLQCVSVTVCSTVRCSVCLSVCVTVHRPVCLSVCVTVHLSVCLSAQAMLARLYNETRIFFSLLSRCAREKLKKR